MLQTDTVTFQTKTETNINGAITIAWADSANTTKCNVQDISKETVLKRYGYTDATEYLQVFDDSNDTNWKETYQVKFNLKNYLVKKVTDFSKLGVSNHTYVILQRVI